MTPKQELFIAEYLVDQNAAAAAIRAGYSERSAAEIGSENLGKPHIASVVKAKMAERCARIEARAAEAEAQAVAAGKVTVPWVLGLIHDTATRCADPEAYQPQAVLRAADLAGRHLSMFVDRVDLSANVTFNISLGANGDGYFERQAAGKVIEGEVIDGDEGAREDRPVGQLRHEPGGSGQSEGLGQGEGQGEEAGEVHERR